MSGAEEQSSPLLGTPDSSSIPIESTSANTSVRLHGVARKCVMPMTSCVIVGAITLIGFIVVGMWIAFLIGFVLLLCIGNMLSDAYFSSGTKPREHRAMIFGALCGMIGALLGGFYLQEAWLIDLRTVTTTPISATEAIDSPGIVEFQNAKVDVDHFTSVLLYQYGTEEVRVCVAPIINKESSGKDAEKAIYWAVDERCCTDTVPCSTWNEDYRRGTFIRTVSQMLEARDNALAKYWSTNSYKVHVSPVFLRWTRDPVSDQKSRHRKGWTILCIALSISALSGVVF